MLKKLLLEINNKPVFYKYLKGKGYSKQLLYKYVKNGWLEKVHTGIYKKSGAMLNPMDILEAVDLQLGLKFHIGAQSALYLQKIMHYLKFDENYIIFLHTDTRINPWLKSLNYFNFKRKNILFSENIGLGIKDNIQISCAERGLIEMAALAPKEASMAELYKIIKLLPNLDPILMQTILINCKSIKAKRIFLFLAEKVSHKWFKKLEIEKIDLGKGIRQIIKNGIFYKKYKIVASREFLDDF